MTETAQIPPEFELALLSLRQTRKLSCLRVEEIPAPPRMAPYAAAISALSTEDDPGGRPLVSGRFVLLYDPQGQAGWEGNFRIIALVSAAIETELGTDALAGQVAWSWLRDSLADHGAVYRALVGTVTTQVSEAFGGLELASSQAQIEIRASWTPASAQLDSHFDAWTGTLLLAGGLYAEENVTQLRT